MTSWADLDRELDRWAEAGRVATFWWRDDDAIRPNGRLDRLLDIARAARVEPLLAVIPALAWRELAERLAREPATVAQHGYAHDNHAAPAQKKAELGVHRPAQFVLGELARGSARMDELFGPRWVHILVPPFNRIAPAVVAGLPAIGFFGLSTYAPRTYLPRQDFIEVNTHIDIMSWTDTQGFVGEAAALGLAIAHLAARRDGRCDTREPTGLLTHHMAHDAAAWDFIAAFLRRVQAHRAARWLTPLAAFARPAAPARAAS